MDFRENLRMALTALAQNRTRSLLTMLGIIIGVSSVIALLSLGRGVQQYVVDEFNSLGANLLTVYSSPPESDTRDRIEPLTTVVLDDLRDPSIAPSVLRVGAEYNVVGYIASDGASYDTTITGTTPNLTDIQSWQPRDGRFITDDDLEAEARVVVLGIDVVEELYDDREHDPVGDNVRINEQVFTVIGVMEPRGDAFSTADTTIFVPLSTAQTKLSDARARGGHRVTTVYVQARSGDLMDHAVREIDRYLYDKHDIRFDGEQDYTILDQSDLLEALNSVTGLLTTFLGVIAGISLLVGGIGIMNIMLVTVTERTREIGLRKALGARGFDILAQFLTESLVLALVGGLIGIILASSLIYAAGAVIPQLTLTVSAGAIMLATSISTFVGIFFGLYPANRAAKMRPIDALRFE